jgi:hypothetical protein
MACRTIRLWCVAVTFCLGFQLLPAGRARAQGSAEDETVAAVKAARQKVAKDLGIDEDEIRVLETPLSLPDHISFHRPAKGKASEPETRTINPVLLRVDADLGNRLCGQPYVLVEPGEAQVFPQHLDPILRGLPFTDEECQRVLLGVDQFMQVALDWNRGPERFLPLLAGRVIVDSVNEDGWNKLSRQEQHQLVALRLQFAFYGVLCDIEDIKLASLDDDEELNELFELADQQDAQGTISVETVQAAFELMFKKIRSLLESQGMLDEGHLAAVRPYMRYYPSLIGKHQFASDDTLGRDLAGALLYSQDWGPTTLDFVWESGRLKLCGLYQGQ